MLGRFLQSRKEQPTELLTSKLFDQDSFYPAFLKDMNGCCAELIIESAFITCKRLNQLMPTLEKLKARKVKVVVNTRDPRGNDSEYHREDTLAAISKLQHAGIQVVYIENHHRKLAVIDRKILFEGSLNILSQNNSREVMRRVESTQLAWEMIRFAGLDDAV